MLKGMVRAVWLLGLIVAVPAFSSIQAATVVYVTLRFGGTPAVAAFALGGGNLVQLGAIADATRPRRIAIGHDGKIYELQDNAVTVYAPGANGNVRPLATISGPRTELADPRSIAIDSRGAIYVTNISAKGVTIYAPGSNGNVAPIGTISGTNTGLAGLSGIAVDSAGKIYVANMRGNCVTVYSAGSHGNVKPVATIIGKVKYPIWFEPHGIAVDSSGRIFLLMQNAINIYSPGSNGAATPVAVISIPITGALTDIAVDSHGKIFLTNAVSPLLTFRSQVLVYSADSTGNASPLAIIEGSNTGLDYPGGVAVDAGGKIYVTMDGRIPVFSAGSNGNVKPITTITSENTGLTQPYGVALGADGKIYVADKHVGPRSCGKVLVYAPGSYGDRAPIAVIEGPHTALQQPIGIAVDRRGNVYVANQEGINQCGPGHSTIADINRATPYASVTEYSADAIGSGGGDVQPVATIGGVGSEISSIALDPGGKVYATFLVTE